MGIWGEESSGLLRSLQGRCLRLRGLMYTRGGTEGLSEAVIAGVKEVLAEIEIMGVKRPAGEIFEVEKGLKVTEHAQ